MSGAASNNRGKATDRAIARWAREHGFPAADRIVKTGYRTGERAVEDPGDQWWAPGLLVQSKSLRPVNRAERAVAGWLAETEAQRRAAGADVALLVVRRDGTADVGEWWAWLRMGATERLLDLVAGWTELSHDFADEILDMPVRLLVADAARLLRAAGYGSPLDEEATG